METNNRNLIILAVVAFVMLAAASGLTFIKLTRPEPPSYRAPSDEIATAVRVTPEITRTGGHELSVEGPLELEVDRKSKAKAVTLQCAQWKSRRPIPRNGPSRYRVVFPDVPFGDASCGLLLAGTRASYEPVFPGDKLKCKVTERMQTECEGGVANDQAATVTIRASGPAELSIDDVPLGPLPVERVRVKVGRRTLSLHLSDGRLVQTTVLVRPEESIDIHFPLPS